MGADTKDGAPPAASDSYHHQPSHSIRRISGIYIRNLTPFPHRDRVMSFLDNCIISSGQNPSPSVADDLDIILARKRARRISSASAVTLLSRRSDDVPVRSGSPDPDNAIRATGSNRAPAGSVSSQSSFQATGFSSGPKRCRPASNAISTAEPSAALAHDHTSTSTLSQRNLEHVIFSRLFETFITLSTVPKPPSPSVSRERTLSSASRLRVVAERPSSPSPSTPTGGGYPSTPRSSGSPFRGVARSSSTLTRRPNSGYRNRASSGSIPRSTSSKSLNSPPGIKSNVLFTAIDPPPPIPFYISPLHAPSTNPSWTDIKPRDDFSPDADIRGRVIQVTLSGRGITSTLERPPVVLRTGDKGKGREELDTNSGWKALASWEVDLDKLQPFSTDFTSTSEELPPNSIVFSMHPSGTLFFIPPKDFYSESRSPSPEHNVSDGELDVPTSRARARRRTPSALQQEVWKAQRKSSKEIRARKGATLQDTTRLVKLQASIAEARNAMDEIVANIDGLVHDEGQLALVRESEQLATSLACLQEEKAATMRGRGTEKDVIIQRKTRLEMRRKDLRAAMCFNGDDISEVDARQEEIDKGRTRVAASKASLMRQRAHVVRALEHIYPIEPLSPPDLLFTILSIPLPVPANPSDPAPPLSHPNWPAINDDSIAIALGYTAQVVLALGVYLNAMLPYPIVCAGSRSVIKDPISTMHGPRTFPLYSKGVDTYRFEYAVFLLNKDIETLMTHQGLQALDMRHTLPNLKNLLLTLTSSLEDEENSPTTHEPAHENTNAEDTSIAETDTGARTPRQDNPLRKPFFAPISGFWLAKSASSAARTSNELPAPPLPSFARPSEDSEVAAATLTWEPEAPAEHQPPLEDSDNLKLSNGKTATLNGLSVDSDTATSEESAAETVGTSVDDGDTETIKDGTVGRTAVQGSWITKAFFGQIDRERDREKAPHGATIRRKRSTAAAALAVAATAGAGVGR